MPAAGASKEVLPSLYAELRPRKDSSDRALRFERVPRICTPSLRCPSGSGHCGKACPWTNLLLVVASSKLLARSGRGKGSIVPSASARFAESFFWPVPLMRLKSS